MSLTLSVVDAFTDQPFTGNPAAIAMVERFPDDGYMQAVANEMNLSETAFVVAHVDGDHDLRWFTPTTEVNLCGHATLAAAHVLGGSARFHTRRSRSYALVELADADAVRRLKPDLSSLAAIDARAVIVTAAGDQHGVDCVSRVFGPNVGIPEDPVTGSAHCTLAVFWGDRLAKTRLVGEQASARGGIVHMDRRGDRVILGGRAVTVGEMKLAD